MALLKTKFLHPVTSEKSISRDRLFNALTYSAGKRAAFVIAPAGFGKTTLIAQWAAESTAPNCWLSLDSTDNHLQGFWHYVIGALQQAWPKVGLDALHLFNAGGDVLPAITSLLNDIATQQVEAGKPLALVLDDYHLVENAEIHRTLAYFVDYLPPSLFLVIASRIEPDLPLPRWRVKSFITELYMHDLAFSAAEIQEFFDRFTSHRLSEQELEAIQQSTQGWIAAIQLMVLSHRQPGPADSASQLDMAKMLSGSKRLIDDYVLTEILAQQPAEVQSFLLDTACLTRMNHELCDFIREARDSREILQGLERANLFIVPLDNRQFWYRYHDLFREALWNRAQQMSAENARTIQRKAIRWFLEQNFVHEGLSQLISLQDWPWMVEVLEEQGNFLIRSGYHLYLIEWLNLLPSNLLERSPRLLMLRIWCLFYDNKIEPIKPHLQQLRQLLETNHLTYALSDAEYRQLQNEASLIQSYLARSTDKTSVATNLTHQVLEQIRDTDVPLKSVSYYGVGLDYFGVGELGLAIEALESAIHFGKLEQRYSTVLSSLGLLMWIHFSRGDLMKALAMNQATQVWLDNFHKHQPQPDLVSCWRNTSLSEIYREQNNLTAAQAYLNPLLRYFETTEPGQRIMIHYAQAGLAYSQRKFTSALEHLDYALAIYDQKKDQILFEPPSLKAMKLRCFLAQEDIAQAQIQARQIHSARSSNPLNQQREALCLSRLEIALGNLKQAKVSLHHELAAVRQKHYVKLEIQCLILLAFTVESLGEQEEAVQYLKPALELAERTQSIRLFADENFNVLSLIERSSDANVSSQFLQTLCRALADLNIPTGRPPQESRAEVHLAHLNTELAEPISKRELEVLNLINEGLANKQIASRLQLAPATVKAHIRNLYGKIGATSRTEALAKARKLGLME